MKKVLLFGALAALLLGCNHAPKQKESAKDNEAFEACFSISDYRAYMNAYGTKGLHFNEAKNIVDRYVADSIVKAQNRERAIEKAEAEEKEDELYFNCTTIAACEKYLKAYPRGRYVKEVEAMKTELELKDAKAEAEKAKLDAEQARKEAEKAKKEAEANKKKTDPKKVVKVKSNDQNKKSNKKVKK